MPKETISLDIQRGIGTVPVFTPAGGREKHCQARIKVPLKRTGAKHFGPFERTFMRAWQSFFSPHPAGNKTGICSIPFGLSREMVFSIVAFQLNGCFAVEFWTLQLNGYFTSGRMISAILVPWTNGTFYPGREWMIFRWLCRFVFSHSLSCKQRGKRQTKGRKIAVLTGFVLIYLCGLILFWIVSL